MYAIILIEFYFKRNVNKRNRVKENSYICKSNGGSEKWKKARDRVDSGVDTGRVFCTNPLSWIMGLHAGLYSLTVIEWFDPDTLLPFLSKI